MSFSSTMTPGRLAGALQESLTAVVRLRADRQPVTDAAAFRAQLMQLLAKSEQDALAMGFSAQDARLAIFAIVAFLDESVLNTRTSVFADWARRPLQDELFGGHMGGEWFFQHLDQLLARPDGPELGDLLEVHQLCLLLGFRGKYGGGDNGQLHATTTRVAERLGRLRGTPAPFAPHWHPPADRVDTKDPWLRPLSIAAMASTLFVVLLWGAYALTLRSDIDALSALAPVATSSASSVR